jgi:rhodanese-related sulfurtransferase
MDFVINNWMLIAVAAASGGMLLWPWCRRHGGGLSPNNAVLLINREKASWSTSREADEFAAGHVVGARNVPLNDLEKRLPEVVKNKTVPLVLVCATGARAHRALAVAKKLGYDKAQVMAGGLKAWKDANLPVEKA